ncbi:hypothetical protein OIA45_39600 [Streptomyces chartreusis]|nr:hypothetical protein OIA45_39600 [Streptomyces chartreusis]
MDPGEIPDGRTAGIRDRPGGHIEWLLDSSQAQEPLRRALTRVTAHCVEHGLWRQRWTDDGRLEEPPEELRMAVLRWETVPPDMLPTGRLVVPIEVDSWCVLAVDERYCSQRLLYDMNDLQLRLAGDGLWVQTWLRPPPASTHTPAPHLSAPPL